MANTTEQGEYKDISYESNNELWFLMWAFELLEKGFVKEIKRADSFSLTEGLDNEFVIVDKKGKEVTKRQTILRPSEYTPEFFIKWDNSAVGKVLWVQGNNSKWESPLIAQYMDGEIVTLIECKSGFDFNNMTRIFKNNQKFMWDKYHIFVNLAKMPDFFEKSFCPREFMITKTGRPRTIHFSAKTIAEFLNP